MKLRKRVNATGISSTNSYIARTMRTRMPKILANFGSQITEQIEDSAFTSDQLIITALPTSTSQKLQIPSTSAPQASLQQISTRTGKSSQKSPKFYRFDQNDCSGEFSDLCLCSSIWLQLKRINRAGDIESIQTSIVQSKVDSAAQVESIPNPYPSSDIGTVSTTDIAAELNNSEIKLNSASRPFQALKLE